MTDHIDLPNLGEPVASSWQVQLVKQADGTMWVKQVILTPVGVLAFFWDANQAQMLASKLREGGRAAAAGTFAPVRPGGARAPVTTTATPEASSPAQGAERR